MTLFADDAATEPPSTAPSVPLARPAPSRTLAQSRAFGSSLTFLAFLAIFAGYSVWLGDRFLDPGARLLNLHQNVPVLLIALAAMITLVAGKFDLSVSSTASLTAYLAIGLRTEQGLPFWAVLVACLAVGVAVGLVNGFLVEYLSINAFIATLGSGGVILGISSVYSGGGPLIPSGPRAVPGWFDALGSFASRPPAAVVWAIAAVACAALVRLLGAVVPSRWDRTRSLAARTVAVAAAAALVVVGLDVPSWSGGVSWLTFLLLVVATAMWVLLELTAFGRGLKASGANPEAARLAGIHTRRHVLGAFVLGGVLAALAGVILAATQGSVAPDLAGAFLLPAFAAAFLSTVVFSAGAFTVWGTVIGGVFVVWVGQGLIVGGLPNTWTDIVNGAVLLIAVSLSTVVRIARR
ncbi:putative multiple sugar transport system permease protein [Frankia canadensis]|uniref:Putative multiple sugar transport system permease protein n=1 Tax=Frankia canadensis TaxID=1836972 RepID=A0A2I2KJU2_9ACTN|nr:ABC transporter permease [Frankia canadensis]SNQ45933.1 putative multiple sugar transport system permease protein [Frankia canadensis]SOU53223.1 putative multiple sugar transport system permease protein [Frankia canadensis]